MKKFTGLCVLVAALCAATGSFAQGFKKTYGGSGFDSGRELQICSNGDYLVLGISTTYSARGDSDVYVARISPSGNKLWHKTYGGRGNQIAWSIRKTSDGNFIIAGSAQSPGSDSTDVLLMKINEKGDSLWARTYGGVGLDDGKEAIETKDGGIIISGYTSTNASYEDYRCALIKTDANGQMQWMRQYATTQNRYFGGGSSVKQTPDGGYVYLGQTHGADFENTDMYMVKVNGNGDVMWSKTLNMPMKERGQYVHVNPDGTIITVGDQETGSAGGYDLNVRKFDANGKELWSKLFGGDDKDIGKMLQPTSDGGYLVVGNTRSFGLINPDFYVMKLDANGNALWTRNYGGTDHEHCYIAMELSNNGIITLGHTRSFSSSTDVYLVQDYIKESQLSVNPFREGTINIYPNPASSYLKLSGSFQGKIRVMVADMLGKTVLSNEYENNDLVHLDLQGIAKGIYTLNVVSGDNTVNRKIVVQ
jgi:hypothetical protein